MLKLFQSLWVPSQSSGTPTTSHFLSLKVLETALYPRFPLQCNEKPTYGGYLPYKRRKTVKNTKEKTPENPFSRTIADRGGCYGGFPEVGRAF